MLRKAAVAILTLACAAPIVGAQTVDEIVAKNIEAHGGAAKIKATKTIKETGKIEVGPGMEAPAVQYQMRPSNLRREFTLQGMTAVQAYDGTQAWGIMPFMGKKDPDLMPAEDRDEMIDEADMDGPLVDYAQKGNKVEFLGKDKLEGTDVYKLKVTLKDGAIQTLYIDTDSNLEIRVDTERIVRGTPHKNTTVIGDYKQIDGIAVTFSMESSRCSPCRPKPLQPPRALTPPSQNRPLPTRSPRPRPRNPRPQNSNVSAGAATCRSFVLPQDNFIKSEDR
jgi:hypothetical protein